MPVNRAGKVVRCPECKRVIRLHDVTQTEIRSGKPIPMTATGVDETEIGIEEPEISLPTIDATCEESVADSRQRPRLSIPEKIGPPSVRVRKRGGAGKSDTPLSNAGQISRLPTTLEHAVPAKTAAAVSDFIKPDTRKADMQHRVRAANADRRILLNFFAACLCVVAAVNLGPAIYYWIQWSQNVDSPALPRWIYLQAFVAAVHVMYAVFLVQIPDWSALKTVAIAMLVMATLFGSISTGLVAGGGQGAVAQFLELPQVLTSRASIWCVAMLLLSTLMCYLGGREALNWQRTERLLREILT
jgi:hypothetical protein